MLSYFDLLCAVVFIAGSPLYVKTAPQGNIIVKVCKCIGVSVTCLRHFKVVDHPNRDEEPAVYQCPFCCP